MKRLSPWFDGARRLLLALISIGLFILALMLVKRGAAPLAPLIRDTLSVDSPASALGFGWISAMLALSGSPIAAAALSLQDAGVLSVSETYGMIAGTRLGASFIVLLIGIIYIMRGRPRQLSLGIGLLSLLVTQTMYFLVIPIGAGLLSLFLRNGPGSQANLTQAASTDSIIDLFFDPIVNFASSRLPEYSLFIFGVLIIILSLRLFDIVIPELNLQNTDLGLAHRLLLRPWVSFILGLLITIITMSVSVSLGLLIPLSVRGYIRRENAIPYVMGANITTFVDTLAAAGLIGSSAGMLAVTAQMASTFITGLLILIFFRPYERLIQRLLALIGDNTTRLVIYISLMFVVPFLLIWLG
jgi:Na+/phosphate symporter